MDYSTEDQSGIAWVSLPSYPRLRLLAGITFLGAGLCAAKGARMALRFSVKRHQVRHL